MKLSDAVEADLEAELDRAAGRVGCSRQQPPQPVAARPRPSDRARAEADVERWCQSLVDSLEGRRLDGLSVVIDCANGSSSTIAPDLLRRLGADGRGAPRRARRPQHQRAVRFDPPGRPPSAPWSRPGATIGLAFDGDADRVLAVDERGELIDGDHLIALCALDLRARGGSPTTPSSSR